MHKRYLKFWGTRGSCPVSGAEYSRFGGNTSCLEIVYDGARLVFDAGTGIRPLGKQLIKASVQKIDLFISHMHLDHIVGFPFFDPVYNGDVELTIWAPRGPGRSCRDLLAALLAPEFFPLRLQDMKAKIVCKEMDVGIKYAFGPFEVSAHRLHHPGMTIGFKIKTPKETIGYVTDNEILIPFQKEQESLVAFFKGCDFLVHEAQYCPEEYASKSGWGHSGLNEAFAFVEGVKPGKWLVVHHDPEHSDAQLEQMALLAQRCPIASMWVKEGDQVVLE